MLYLVEFHQTANKGKEFDWGETFLVKQVTIETKEETSEAKIIELASWEADIDYDSIDQYVIKIIPKSGNVKDIQTSPQTMCKYEYGQLEQIDKYMRIKSYNFKTSTETIEIEKDKLLDVLNFLGEQGWIYAGDRQLILMRQKR